MLTLLCMTIAANWLHAANVSTYSYTLESYSHCDILPAPAAGDPFLDLLARVWSGISLTSWRHRIYYHNICQYVMLQFYQHYQSYDP